MKLTTRVFRPFVILTAGAWLWLSSACAPAYASSGAVPEVLQAGFASWSKGGSVDVIVSGWEKGGLLEASNKAAGQAEYIKNVVSRAGSYRTHEVLRVKAVGRSAEIVYLSINFERGALYARFLLYHAVQGWVVQNMDFSIRPEALMPWLAVEGDSGKE